MGSAQTEKRFDHLQDVLGNLPMVKTYTVTCLGFSLEEALKRDEVCDFLQSSLDQLSAAFPYLTGGVFFEGKGDGSTGTSRIVYLQDQIPLIIKDFRDDPTMPSISDLSKARYPASMLDGNILSPFQGCPASFDESETDPAPVLILQANILKGGLLLTFAGNHVTMDMNGLGQFIYLFSKACRGETFTQEEVKQGNQDRKNAVKLFGDDYVPGPELDDVRVQPHAETKNDDTTPQLRWDYFNFSATSLEQLKQEASHQAIVPYITTDDAISVLIWQHIAKARSARLGSGVNTSLVRAIDARKYMDLDKLYLGHMVASVHMSETDVGIHPLGEVTGRLRKAMQDTDISFRTRALATMLHRTADKSQYVYAAGLDFDKDVILSSWSKTSLCNLDFGTLLGVPEAVRRPSMVAFPSLVYLMPKSRDGAIAVAMCLREDDLARLREDEGFGRYTEYLG